MRLIDAEELTEMAWRERVDTRERIVNLIARQPTIKAKPVKYGHWYDNTYRYIGELDAYFIQACCSCCNRYSDKLDQYTKIMSNETCSHCGADMRGEQNENN